MTVESMNGVFFSARNASDFVRRPVDYQPACVIRSSGDDNTRWAAKHPGGSSYRAYVSQTVYHLIYNGLGNNCGYWFGP